MHKVQSSNCIHKCCSSVLPVLPGVLMGTAADVGATADGKVVYVSSDRAHALR